MKTIHKGKRDKNFHWVAQTVCEFYGSKCKHFEYTSLWKYVTCKRCLARKESK
jgi:hypothetical protein